MITAEAPLSSPGPTAQFARWGRFAIVVAAIVAIPAVVISILSLQSKTREELANWENHLTALADGQAAALEQVFTDGAGVARMVATYPTAIYVASGSQSPSRPFPEDVGALGSLRDLLSTAATAYRLPGIWVSRSDAVLAASAGAPRIDSTLLAATREAVAGNRVVVALADIAGNQSAVLFAAPIHAGPRNTPVGAALMLGGVTVRANSILRAADMSNSTLEGLLVGAQGDSVVFLTSSRFLAGAAAPRMPRSTPHLAAATALDSGGRFGDYVDFRGVPVYAVTRRLGTMPLGLVMKVDRSEVAVVARHRAKDEVIQFVLILALVVGLGLVAWQTAGGRLRTSLMKSESQVRMLSRAVEQSPASIVITDPAGRIVYVNPKFETVTGYSAAEAIGQNPRMLKSGKQGPDFYHDLWTTVSQGGTWRGELENRRKDGSLFRESASITPVTGPEGVITHFLAIKEDITEQRLLEAQYRQAQKMEAIGRLAGGVAHDFNNILTVIMGCTGSMLADVEPDSPWRTDLMETQAAATRAAGLTRQLLAFSRKQVIQPGYVDVNAVVRNLDRMVRRIIGETIAFEIRLAQELPTIFADAGQLEQVILNLCVNARDAMPNGGTIRIGTAPGGSPEEENDGPAYITLSISDTGVGMSDEVKSHLFEPFFTTKGVGKGTGLGLSTVYGIVHQAGGDIDVESETGKGTTFRIFLPVATGAPTSQVPARQITAPGGTETILLAEDEAGVRSILQRVLKERGYSVLPAANGAAALEIARSTEQPIHLLMTDVVMPGMSGPALAQQFRRARPDARVLFISGYTDTQDDGSPPIDPRQLLSKPFNLEEVARRVRQALDE